MTRFANLDPRHRPNDFRAIWRWGVSDRLSGRRRVSPPGPPAPRVEPDLDLVHERSERPRLTWIGHASFLAALGGRSFLVDPVFGRRVGWVYRRHGLPGLSPHQLPELTVVLVTHNHYDHLERDAVQNLAPEIPVVVPAGLGRRVERWSLRPVVELEWWQTTEIDGLRITLVPARHWSRRRIFDTNSSLWGGFVVERRGQGVYFAGDTAWFDGFSEIGRRFPGLLATVLPIGGYSPAWFMENHHLNAAQAGQAFTLTEARFLVPMHWGAFQLTDEPLAEPIRRLESWWRRQGPRDGRQMILQAVGETVVLETGEAAR